MTDKILEKIIEETKKIVKELKDKPSEAVIIDSAKIFYDNIK